MKKKAFALPKIQWSTLAIGILSLTITHAVANAANTTVAPSASGRASIKQDTQSTGEEWADVMSDRLRHNDSVSGSTTTPTNKSFDRSVSGTTFGGESRGAAPRIASQRNGYFTLGVGPSFPAGLNSNTVMYGINGAYTSDLSERIGARLFGSLNFGAETDASRFFDFGAGMNVYIPEARMTNARPYLTADVGIGSARRRAPEVTKDAVTAGVGAGFQFAAQELNMDVVLHYTQMTASLEGNIPSILALQLAVNF